MMINGNTVPWAVASSVLVFTFWLGGLSYNVIANANDIDDHKKKPAHEQAAQTDATMAANVAHNKEVINKLDKKIDKEVDELKAEIEKSREEILRAIRESR